MATFKKGDKVNTPRGTGIVDKDYGKNVAVKMDKRSSKGRVEFYNFSVDEIVIAGELAKVVAATLELTAIYTADFKKVIVKFFSDDTTELVALGDVSESLFQSFIDAGGSDIDGFECEIF